MSKVKLCFEVDLQLTETSRELTREQLEQALREQRFCRQLGDLVESSAIGVVTGVTSKLEVVEG